MKVSSDSKPGFSPNPEVLLRLRNAINLAGGPLAISRASGIPLSTLNDYLKSNDVRFSRMAIIAKACQISLDWLAFGPKEEVDPPREISLLRPDLLYAPAHFWALFVLIRSCQEYHEQMKLLPTLADVFEWIGPAYDKARALPDQRVEFKPPEDASP